ncbi:LacI family DNA-binding transcriptional regulator [Herbiconiux sp. 11R-BC]|uniref:LacI family DNA-binding transcriptional regulator n=1 Tax=Herbiconiux sp. 11R-BC TaxID=3111637 RepID=UPI003C0DA4B6
MGTKPVRLIDLARAANVSIATASQVMNGSGRVAPATRQRVFETAERLDYRPNALARSVASGRSNTVGVLAENASGAFCMPVLVGANRALSDVDLASTLYDAAHDRRLRREHVRRLQSRHVDGVVVLGEGTDFQSISVSHEFTGPVVYALSRSDDPADTSVLPDDAHAGVLAAQHFVEIGRSRILHVTAESGLNSVRDRERGLRETLKANGLELAAPVLYGEFRREWGFEATRRIVAEGLEYDAIFAGNDEIAIGLYAQLLASGVRVPDDVAIIGVDNAAGMAASNEGFLTSVDLRFDAVGSAAVDLVVSRLEAAETAGAATSPEGSDAAADAVNRTVPGMLVTGRSTLGGPPSTRSLVLEALIG